MRVKQGTLTIQYLLVSAAVAALLVASVGCADGPIRRWFRGSRCNSCIPPAAHPGFGFNQNPACDSLVGSQGIDQGTISNYGDYDTSGYGGAYADPYSEGSIIDGGTINPGNSDAYGNGSFNGIVPPLPGPTEQ